MSLGWKWVLIKILLLLLSVVSTTVTFPVEGNFFKLRVLHTNDMHSRFDQVSQSAGKCSQYEEDHNLCYGGFARVRAILDSELDRAKKENVSVLSLNAGDNYQGTVWYSIFKWEIVSVFVNMLPIDAMALGNHEFDDGIEGLIPFLKDVKIPILASNLDLSEEPEMLNASIKRSLTLEREGRKIGIIGFLTPETSVLSSTGKLKFKDEVESLTEEAKILKREGVDIIIALGHSGYDVDLKIAAEVPDVDVVVGGHSHSFLYSGTPPDSDIPIDTYPVMVKQKSGRTVAVVQAYAFTKYLGVVDLWFDEKGELKNASGNPILLNNKVPRNSKVLEELDKWESRMNESLWQNIGKTKVYLDGNTCRFYECNLGNLITDAFVHYAVKNYAGPYWTNAAIGIQQGGGIRASINTTGSNEIITKEDVIISVPFFTPVSIVKVEGKDLMAALEWSVARYDPNHKIGRGEFLQVSGLKVKYDLRKAVGSRVVSVTARCSVCQIPTFEPLRLEKFYNIIMPTFLLRGGDNFTMFRERGEELVKFNATDTNMIAKYIEDRSWIYNGIEGRIEFDGQKSSSNLSVTFTISYLYILFFLIFIFK